MVLALQNIHAIESETVQFVLCVLVYPYPNDIFSVWVYVMSLTPKHK